MTPSDACHLFLTLEGLGILAALHPAPQWALERPLVQTAGCQTWGWTRRASCGEREQARNGNEFCPYTSYIEHTKQNIANMSCFVQL